jgi:hypothetical protein
MNLYIIGFVDSKSARVLINPGYCRSIAEVLEYLEEHELAHLISEGVLSEKLCKEELIRLEVPGSLMAILIGDDKSIDFHTDRFVCTGNKRFYPV